MEKYRPNPMYLFSTHDCRILSHALVPIETRQRKRIYISSISLRFNDAVIPSYTPDVAVDQLVALSKRDELKIILKGGIDSTIKTPHHILNDASMKEEPGREGPIRTYFDGSFVEHLGHAVAICIDNVQGTLTTQCPRGHDFPAQAEEIVRCAFPAHERITIRDVQQTDVHSCVPLTLYNIFKFADGKAGGMASDTLALRKNLTGLLDAAEEDLLDIADTAFRNILTSSRREALYNPSAPIFRQRYIPAITDGKNPLVP